MEETASITVTIVNKLGLHARPAMAFVDVASGFGCEVTVRRGDQSVDGKSIMEMLMLAATQGTSLEITARGSDAKAAVAALKKLVDAGFDDD